MTRTPWCVSAQLGRSCQEDEFVAWWRAFINVAQRCSPLFKDDTEHRADSSSWWLAPTEQGGLCYTFLDSLGKFHARESAMMKIVFPLEKVKINARNFFSFSWFNFTKWFGKELFFNVTFLSFLHHGVQHFCCSTYCTWSRPKFSEWRIYRNLRCYLKPLALMTLHYFFLSPEHTGH